MFIHVYTNIPQWPLGSNALVIKTTCAMYIGSQDATQQHCQYKHIAWLGAINCKICLGHVYIDSMDRLVCLTQLGGILRTFFFKLANKKCAILSIFLLLFFFGGGGLNFNTLLTTQIKSCCCKSYFTWLACRFLRQNVSTVE